MAGSIAGRSGGTRRRSWALACCFAVGLACAPAAVLGLDARKGAFNLSKNAAAAFEAGDMARAAQLYLEAFRMDPDQPGYLYGAARAEQAAGQVDHAEAHFRQFVAQKNLDPDRVGRAKAALAELDGVKADAKVEAAERFARRNEWSLALASYREALRLRPDRVALNYQAALAARETGDSIGAAALLHTYLAQAPADGRERAEASALLEALEHKNAASAVVVAAPQPAPAVAPVESVKPVPPPVAAKPIDASTALPPGDVTQLSAQSPHQPRRPIAAWTTVGVGAAVAVAGGICLGVSYAQEADYRSRLNVVDGKVTGSLTNRGDAVTEANGIARTRTAGAVLAGVGLTAVAGGALLWALLPDTHVTLVPDAHGWQLAGRF